MIFVDTRVWSLFLRRDGERQELQVTRLKTALETGESIFTTGIVLQEILQGVGNPRSTAVILEHFAAIPCIAPQRADHVDAAALRNTCRRAGSQIGTIDALIAQLCIRHGLMLLTTDQDFLRIKKISALQVWQP